MQEALELNEGVRRLGMMAAVESNTRNLEMEDEAVKQNILQHESAFFGEGNNPMSNSQQAAEEMRITAARDVHYYTDPNQQPQQQQQPLPFVPPAATRPSTTIGEWTRILTLVAASLAAGGTGAAAINYLWGEDTPPNPPTLNEGSLDVNVRPYLPE